MNNEFLEKVKFELYSAYLSIAYNLSYAERELLKNRYNKINSQIKHIIALNIINKSYTKIKSNGSWGKYEVLRQEITDFIGECYGN